MADAVPELVRGPAFHLEGDGRWDVQQLPDSVMRSAEYSGEIEIDGYPASVFETADGDQWAQKAPGTPSPKGDEGAGQALASMAARVARGSFSGTFRSMADRSASKRHSKVDLERGEMRAALGLLEELKSAADSLDRAVRHSQGLRTNSTLEWIPDSLESQMESLSGAASGIKDSLEYLTRMDL